MGGMSCVSKNRLKKNNSLRCKNMKREAIVISEASICVTNLRDSREQSLRTNFVLALPTRSEGV